MIKVLLVDDQRLLRESMQYIIQNDTEIQVIGSLPNGLEAVEFVRRTQPDVILMDITMPEMDGITATKKIKHEYPQIKIIILTTFETDETILKSFVCGADGFILKDVEPTMLISSIKLTFAGLHVLHPSAYEYIQTHVEKRQDYLDMIDVEMRESLTETDINIMNLIASGHNNKEIADILNFSEGTIKNKVSRLLSILDARDRSHLILIAVKNNLI